jgi:hypothetical protein
MSPFSKGTLAAMAFLLLIPAVAIVAGPRPGGPSISTPTISPALPSPNDQVTVNATVNAGATGVQNVTVVYTTDSWKATNTTVLASYTSTSQIALAHIPPEPGATHVEYYVVAFDTNGNRAVKDNGGAYYSYTVSGAPGTIGTSTWIELAIVLVAVGATVSVAVYSLRPKKPTAH